jgi:outer membrane protein assembly factor BamB
MTAMLHQSYSRLRGHAFCFFYICAVGLMGTALFVQPAFSANQLVTFKQATNNGLQRAWFAQARVDSSRNLVSQWTLSKNEIFALTTASTVHAMNAETGKTLWIAQIGNPDYPSVGPAVNSNRVAVLNSSDLFLLDRKDGHVLWTRNLMSATEVAPVLSETFAYVALISGRVEGFSLDSPNAEAWQYQSVGRIVCPPSATGKYIAWPTERGYLYFGNADESRVFFRIETGEEIVAAPAEWGSLFYVATLNGYLYCYDGSTGRQLWRYSTGMSIISKPVVLDNKVYVASEAPALHAIDATTGKRLWSVEGAVKFVAQAEHHIYASDRYGNLLLLDRETGAINGKITTGDGVTAMVNEQSDRIFLVSDTGLIQCLHEIGADEPTYHRATEATENADKPVAEDQENVFAEEDPLVGETESPFEADEPEEAEESEDGNPFF